MASRMITCSMSSRVRS